MSDDAKREAEIRTPLGPVRLPPMDSFRPIYCDQCGMEIDGTLLEPDIKYAACPACLRRLDELAAAEKAYARVQRERDERDAAKKREETAVEVIYAGLTAALGRPRRRATMKLRPEVDRFAVLMEQELRANDHKPGWKNDTLEALLVRALDEIQELREECATMRYNKEMVDPEARAGRVRLTAQRIGKEAADVANFCMMVADVAGALAEGGDDE